MVVGYVCTFVDVTRVDEARLAKNPWGEGIKHVQDGTYLGEGEGFRGPIQVQVDVKDHRITAVRTLKYPDLISVKENDLKAFTQQIVKDGQLDRPRQPGMFRGAIETLTGYTNAVLAALTKGIPDYPRYSVFSRAFLNAFIGVCTDPSTFERSGNPVRGIRGVRLYASVHVDARHGPFHQLLQLRVLRGRVPGERGRRRSDAHGAGLAHPTGRLRTGHGTVQILCWLRPLCCEMSYRQFRADGDFRGVSGLLREEKGQSPGRT